MRNPWRFPWRSSIEAVPSMKNRSGRELMWAAGRAYMEVVSQEGAVGITEPKQASLGTLSRGWQKAGEEMQVETRRCSAKHPLAPLLTSHWIKQVPWLGADKVGGHQRPWQSVWLPQGARNSSHAIPPTDGPTLPHLPSSFFGFW